MAKISKQQLGQFWSIGLFAFYIFGFRLIEPYVIPPVQAWIQSTGNFAGLSYFFAGLVATVISPISLGPINVILQKSFGFWSSFVIVYSFLSIGQIINFLISKRFGSVIIHKFFPFLEHDPIFGYLRNNLDRSTKDLFLIYLGMGAEIIAYLYGLTKIKLHKFVFIVATTNLLNTWLFVSRNLAIGDGAKFTFFIVLEYIFSILPLVIVFHKELRVFWEKLKKSLKEANALEKEFGITKNEFKEGKISKEEFDIIKTNYNKNSDEILNSVFPRNKK
jgi:uncharacterized membrane protein YdjX (TVP38/TMEM64 family)